MTEHPVYSEIIKNAEKIRECENTTAIGLFILAIVYSEFVKEAYKLRSFSMKRVDIAYKIGHESCSSEHLCILSYRNDIYERKEEITVKYAEKSGTITYYKSNDIISFTDKPIKSYHIGIPGSVYFSDAVEIANNAIKILHEKD